MARAKLDPNIAAHLEWIGFIQPTGLVVSAPALVKAGAILDRRDAEGQRLLREAAEAREFDPKTGPELWLPSFMKFASSVLGWSFSPKGYAGTNDSPIPPELEVALPDYGDILRPTFAVRELEPVDGQTPWQLLVKVLEPGHDFDRVVTSKGRLEASPHGRMERLLRVTGVSAGLLFNGRSLRLISAPRGESSGWMDFGVADMVQTSGRPICTALRLLLGQSRLLSLPRAERLTALLEDSRRYQNEVSERLAEQVLHALYELQRGLQAAHDASKGELLREPLAEHPDEIYRALLTVILRLVFLLYAEERDMLPKDETFLQHYSLAELYKRLREDAALFPDTMDERYGAWAQLLVLFRMIYDGAESSVMKLPRRHGVLFDPDHFKFLEGRRGDGARQIDERVEPPLVPDGTIYRALDKLLVLDGERISYRALDVEQIGSVYETMMGFRLETAAGRSVAVKAQKRHGAPSVVDLEALLAEPPKKRGKWVQDRTDRKLTSKVMKAVQQAANLPDLHAALLPVVDQAATPDLVPKGAMVLQPSEERRRSGSHYTPRELTEPIVRTTLRPILERLRDADGKSPRPEQILDLKVCDPAMGSGAFLVEACRQLGDALIEAWHAHDKVPDIPPDEDEVIFARRLVAQRCLYGVDRNPVAVDLAKVSLWLATLAREHALTFVDHALRHGDSLVGLSRKQIEGLHWDASAPPILIGFGVQETLERVTALRQRIRRADESVSDSQLRNLWDEAQLEVGRVRLFGDIVLTAFFESTKPKEREAARSRYANAVLNGEVARYRDQLENQRHSKRPLVPFHWEIEFSEVFRRENPGFDAVVGNPPFAGKNSVKSANASGYPEWLKQVHAESHGNADLVAHFFRLAFDIIRREGALGLIATNTIGQGDTRSTGLRWICTHGGEIFTARRRVRWPGQAAVVVSVVHVHKGTLEMSRLLDGKEVPTITAYLFHSGGHEDPKRLFSNKGIAYTGAKLHGPGFLFDDSDRKGVSSPIAEMHRLIRANPKNAERIFPYIGGSQLNSSPYFSPSRYVISFGDMSEEEARRWPDLMRIIENKVRPERMENNREIYRRYWWQFGEKRVELWNSIRDLDQVLVISSVSDSFAFAMLPSGIIYNQKVVVFAESSFAAFCVFQARPHEVWVRFTASTLKDDLQYTPSDCLETFPLPASWKSRPILEAAGSDYYQFRSALMLRREEGLTRTYNRFHDPDERDPEILKLRELHSAMDRAVLDAYGWTDIPVACQFVLEYEVDEENWSSRKRKPWRYRWPDEVRDEVLARLLDLNEERAADEARSGVAASHESRKRGSARGGARGRTDTETGDLFS